MSERDVALENNPLPLLFPQVPEMGRHGIERGDKQPELILLADWNAYRKITLPYLVRCTTQRIDYRDNTFAQTKSEKDAECIRKTQARSNRGQRKDP